MADALRFRDYALTLGGTAAAFEKDSITVGGDAETEALRSGHSLLDEIVLVLGKRPVIEATLFDPSLVTAWAALAEGGIAACFRAYEQNGGATGSYVSFTLGQGIVYPVSLRAAARQAARLAIRAHGTFSASACTTLGTSEIAPADLAVAYYPKSLSVGGAIGGLMDVDISWEYQLQDDEQLEPAYYYYDSYAMRGTARAKDLDAATVARLEDGADETVSAVFEDLHGAGSDVTVSFGTCKVFAKVRGDMVELSFGKLA